MKNPLPNVLPCSKWKSPRTQENSEWASMLSLPAFFLSIKNVFVIVEYNDDPSRDPSGTKASISNALRCLPIHIVTYSKPSWPACWPAWLPGPALWPVSPRQPNQPNGLTWYDSYNALNFRTCLWYDARKHYAVRTKSRVIYYRVLITKQLEDRNLEGCIICLPMFSSR